MLVEIPQRFLQKNQNIPFERIFVNKSAVAYVKVDGYDYGKGIEYSLSMSLINGHYVPLISRVDEKLIWDFTFWFDDLVTKKEP